MVSPTIYARAIKMSWNIVRNFMNKRKWERWNNTPKDLVILHTFGKTKTIPSASPFVVKLQTYLRMSKIPHKTDSKDMLGPKGKAPWISLNGVHMGDSELIIAHLNKHFNVDLNKGPYSEKELAIANCAKISLEEHFVWGLALERFVYNPSQFKKVVSVSPIYDKLFITFGGYALNKKANGQGMGRHTKPEVEALCSKDLVSVSKILGNNKFFLGQVPCEYDCGIFGVLAECMWGLPNSPYEKIVSGELTNLRDYCIRMKEIYYPDWEKCLTAPPKAKKDIIKDDDNTTQKNSLKSKL